MEKKRSKGILWRILFFLAVVAAAVILELGKHTILGWILAALLFAGYYLIRSRFWRKWKAGKKLDSKYYFDIYTLRFFPNHRNGYFYFEKL